MQETFEFVVSNPMGLHANIAEQLARTASLYQSDFTLNYDGRTVNLKSVMGVISLGVPQKARLSIVASGNDAKAGIAALTKKIQELAL